MGGQVKCEEGKQARKMTVTPRSHALNRKRVKLGKT